MMETDDLIGWPETAEDVAVGALNSLVFLQRLLDQYPDRRDFRQAVAHIRLAISDLGPGNTLCN